MEPNEEGMGRVKEGRRGECRGTVYRTGPFIWRARTRSASGLNKSPDRSFALHIVTFQWDSLPFEADVCLRSREVVGQTRKGEV